LEVGLLKTMYLFFPSLQILSQYFQNVDMTFSLYCLKFEFL
jgi:hypothetical protein